MLKAACARTPLLVLPNADRGRVAASAQAVAEVGNPAARNRRWRCSAAGGVRAAFSHAPICTHTARPRWLASAWTS